jgi:WD40 repeat protein
VTHVAWSADGSRFASGDAGGRVALRLADGRIVSSFRLRAPVAALAFDGRELVAGAGGHVRIGRREVRVPGALTAVAVAGPLVAVASTERGRVTARILSGPVLAERGIDALAFSPGGRVLATGSTDGTARLWDPATGRLLHVLRHRGHVVSVRFSPDGRELVTASGDGTAGVWDVATGERRLLLVGATGAAEGAAFSPDGKEIAVAFADRVARLYSSNDGRLLAPLAGHRDAVTAVAFSPDGRTLVTASEDGTARLWDAGSGGDLTVADRRSSAVRALFAGSRLLTYAGREARLVSPTGVVGERLRVGTPIVAAAARGASFALVDAAGEVAGETGPTLGIGRVTAVAFAPDGKLVSGGADGRIELGRAPVAKAPGAIAGLAAARDRILARTSSGLVLVYRDDGTLLARIDAHAGRSALSPDGTVAATADGRDATLRDAATGRLLHRLTGHRSLVTDVEFSPDGKLVATASDDHDARLWDVGTGRLLHVLRGHFFPVRTASFSPDGRWVVTASQFTAGLWNVSSGQLLLYLRGHTRPLTGATFSPDGVWIATGSDDGTARTFRCDLCRPLPGLEQLARDRLRRLG